MCTGPVEAAESAIEPEPFQVIAILRPSWEKDVELVQESAEIMDSPAQFTFGPSLWDAAIFIGTKPVGIAGSIHTIVLLLVNLGTLRHILLFFLSFGSWDLFHWIWIKFLTNLSLLIVSTVEYESEDSWGHTKNAIENVNRHFFELTRL